jgi:ribosomal protein S18 acetylase RimI-like enzyme
MQQRLQAAGYRQSFPDAEYRVLEIDGVPCGRIVLAAGAGQLRLVDIALLPEARGQGFGRRVLGALQACAAGHGMPLTLSVHHSNPNARRLYQALGFRALSRDEMAEQMIWNNEPG